MDNKNIRNHYAVIDEIEEGQAVVLFDEGLKLIVSKGFIPAAAREGSVLKVTFEIDEEEQKKRTERISSLQEKLLQRTKNRKK